MELNKRNIIIAIVLLAAFFAAGRFLTPEKIRIETKTVTIEKEVKEKKTDSKKDVDTKRHTETVTTETIKPDGTRIVETRVTENVDQSKETDKKTDTKETKEKTETKEETKIVESGSNRVTIAALGGAKIRDIKAGPVYGGMISRPLLGPVVMGVWGLSDTTAGITLGLQF